MRDHEPIVIEEFNGLWKRGDAESCPLDHFSDCENIQFIYSGFETRDGVDVLYVGPNSDQLIANVARIYTYVRYDNEQRLLVLDTLGNVYDAGQLNPTNPILTIPEMTDFAFVSVGGRAYISPHNGVTGLPDEFLYVYLGDGNPARKAAGKGPVGNTGFAAASSATTGKVEQGYHIFAVVYETDTGFLTRLGPIEDSVDYDDPEVEKDNFFAELNVTVDDKKVSLSGIPVSPNAFVKFRHIVATKAIDPAFYDKNREGYQFFFIPEGKIENNTDTTFEVDFFDQDLLDDASHLLDLFSEIPAFVGLNTYHGRLVGVAEYGAPSQIVEDDESSLASTARVSYPGEPEAIDQVSGLIIAPLDGNELTNAQEFRDVLYLFKKTRTYAYSDNGDDPSSWPLTIIDQGIGASVHGIATVLDSGGVNIEYLIIIDYSGVMTFNGIFQRPELSWKIRDFWFDLDRSAFKVIQCINDSVNQMFYCTLTNYRLLVGDYKNAFDPEKIRWAVWRFDFQVDTITIFNTETLVLGSRAPLI